MDILFEIFYKFGSLSSKTIFKFSSNPYKYFSLKQQKIYFGIPKKFKFIDFEIQLDFVNIKYFTNWNKIRNSSHKYFSINFEQCEWTQFFWTE